MKNNRKNFLRLFIIIGISISFFLPGTTSNAVILNTKENNSKPLTYDYISDNEIIIYFDMQDLVQYQIDTEFGVFSNFVIPNSGFLGVSGKPKLPVVSSIFAVPYLDVSLEVLDAKVDTVTLIDKVYPAQLPHVDSDIDVDYDFVFDEEFYNQDISVSYTHLTLPTN